MMYSLLYSLSSLFWGLFIWPSNYLLQVKTNNLTFTPVPVQIKGGIGWACGKQVSTYLQYYFEFKFVLLSSSGIIIATTYFGCYKADLFQRTLNWNYLVLNSVFTLIYSFLVKLWRLGAH